MKPTLIKNVKCYVTNPNRHNLVVVKIETDKGIDGWGCATFQQRPLTVKNMIDEYFTPLLIGKDANNIEDIWHMLMVNAYWRNGPIINNSVAGVDMALWDIKGKLANMPLYQLFGGQSKDAIAAYGHAEGNTIEEVISNVDQLISEGYKYIRCQIGAYGGKNQLIHHANIKNEGEYYDQRKYMESVLGLFEKLSENYSSEIQFIHDVHERLSPNQALDFSKKMEKFNLYFLEDILPPNQLDWLKQIRSQTATPIAIGELFNNPVEWKNIVINNEIDFLRLHVSQVGGITPVLKIAAFADQFGIKIALHGPSDMSPIGVAVNTHLNIHLHNAAIQEIQELDEVTKELFSDHIKVENGYIYPPQKDGIGIELNEELVNQYPNRYRRHEWTQSRTPNGSIHTP